MRSALIIVAVAGLLAAAGFAQRSGGYGEREPMRRGMGMMGGPMMGMMGPGDVAAWDGHLFVIHAGQLHRLDADLQVTRSVPLPLPAAAGGQEGEEEPAAAPGPGQHMMPGMHRRMMGAPGQPGQGPPAMGRMGMMGRMARLTADSRGVYLAVGPRIVVYDHDLNEVKSTQLPAAEGGE